MDGERGKVGERGVERKKKKQQQAEDTGKVSNIGKTFLITMGIDSVELGNERNGTMGLNFISKILWPPGLK